jgi:hypothetical protein
MSCVTVVGTIHDELGAANAFELYAILTRIRPTVIFLEVPPEAFDDFYGSCSRQNLESLAVRRYRDEFQVELVPVDLPTPRREFFEDHQQLCMRMRELSVEYRLLAQQDRSRIIEYGFAYLNSEYCTKHWTDMYKEVQSKLDDLGDARLVEIHKAWESTIEHREREMIKNISHYSSQKPFEKGAFLIGAAHRRHIIDLARNHTAANHNGIEWILS